MKNYYRAFKLKNGLKFAYDVGDYSGCNMIFHNFSKWCFDTDKIDRSYYECYYEEELEEHGVKFLRIV